MDKDRILRTLERHKDDLRLLGITRIGLFGSYLHETATEKSDIDLLVTFSKASLVTYFRAKDYLEALLGKKVDLVIEEDLRPEIAYVKQEAIYA